MKVIGEIPNEPRPETVELVQSDPVLDREVARGVVLPLGHIAVAVRIPSDGRPTPVPGPDIHLG